MTNNWDLRVELILLRDLLRFSVQRDTLPPTNLGNVSLLTNLVPAANDIVNDGASDALRSCEGFRISCQGLRVRRLITAIDVRREL